MKFNPDLIQKARKGEIAILNDLVQRQAQCSDVKQSDV